MLLIITPTDHARGRIWAWVLKNPANDQAIAVGFGSPSRVHAELDGRIFLAYLGETEHGSQAA